MKEKAPTSFDRNSSDPAPASLVGKIESIGHRLLVRAGQIVLTHGSTGRDVFHVCNGAFEVVLMARDGQAVVVRDLGPGDIFGDLAALNTQPRSASVVAKTNGTLVSVSAEQFLNAIAQDPEASSWFTQRLGREVLRLTNKVFELTALAARDRLHCELWRLATAARTSNGRTVVENMPTHEALAMRIGSQREVVSREMSRLSRQGVLQREGRRLSVDLDKLSSMVKAELGQPALI